MYVRLVSSLQDKGRLIRPELVDSLISSEKAFYTSLYYYSEEHKKQFDERKTVSGITDVSTDTLVFDIDNELNIEKAKSDAELLLKTLVEFGIEESSIQLFFSGKKGFHVKIKTNSSFTPEEHREIALHRLGKNIELDTSVYNASRIFRVEGTKHQETGLYKIPLEVKNFTKMSIADILKKAKSLDNITEDFNWSVSSFNFKALIKLKKVVKRVASIAVDLSFKEKPEGWRNCKWSILNGYYEPGQRHTALLVLAATLRGMNYPRDLAFYMCKSSIEKQQQINGYEKEFSEDELRDNILESVYGEAWTGGQHTCKKPGWLQDYCTKLGDHACVHGDGGSTVSINETFDLFKEYAVNIDAITIKTGIKQLDALVRLTIGMFVGIVGAPASGKTTLTLQMLNTMSKRDEQCIFFSYDMYHATVYQKLAMRHMKMSETEIFKRFQSGDQAFMLEVKTVIEREYKNVEFCFVPGQDPEEIKRTIRSVEEKTSKKVRLAVVDYNELVMSDVGDPTAASAKVAQKLRAIAIDLNCCVITLMQPSKVVGNPADEILSYRNAKGSSANEQAVGIMLGISRPGYDPKTFEDDRFMTINGLKNRMGSLFSLDLGWDGAKSEISELSHEGVLKLENLRLRIKEAKAEASGNRGGGW